MWQVASNTVLNRTGKPRLVMLFLLLTLHVMVKFTMNTISVIITLKEILLAEKWDIKSINLPQKALGLLQLKLQITQI
jgi:hypothetical protein